MRWFRVVWLFVGILVLSSCEDNLDNPTEEFEAVFDSTLVYSIKALMVDNKGAILNDVSASIDSNKIVLASPYIVNPRNLVLTVETSGGGIFKTDGLKVKNGQKLSLDLTNKQVIRTEGTQSYYYEIECYYSGLPILEINKPNNVEVISKEDWISDTSMRIINPDGSIDCEGGLSIKGRGNATWTDEKKGYALKLDEKSKILGMKSDKRWVLLPNGKDRTLIRNALGFEIARLTDLEWTPSGKFVELILNGEHLGNYYLAEKIKVGSNRLNIDKENGFLMEMDSHYDEPFKFKSLIKEIPYMFKDPDEVSDDQVVVMQTFINLLEESIYDDNKFSNGDYNRYIDIGTFVDWWIALELSQNQEPNHPASCFCYKDKDSKLKMGPVWDYDVYTFNSVYRLDTLAIRNALYYDKLFAAPEFKDKLKQRWAELKPKFEVRIPTYIDDLYNRIRPSALLNHYIWQFDWSVDMRWVKLDTPYNSLSWRDNYTDYDNAIETIQQTFRKKLNNLDMFITTFDN